MNCPRLGCEAVLRFDGLTDEERTHFLDNREQYQT
jgi:hypothetical protein